MQREREREGGGLASTGVEACLWEHIAFIPIAKISFTLRGIYGPVWETLPSTNLQSQFDIYTILTQARYKARVVEWEQCTPIDRIVFSFTFPEDDWLQQTLEKGCRVQQPKH